MYSRTTGIIATSTTPYYGGGLRLFPYARLVPDKLQLRLGRISPLTGFLNILKLFEGSYHEKGEWSFGCLDFIRKDFEVEVRSASSFQHRGESMGCKEWFRLTSIPQTTQTMLFLI